MVAVSTLNTARPVNGDATPQAETRANFSAIEHLLGVGPIQTVTGANAAATDLDAATYGRFNISTDAAGGANDFDLSLPAHIGQTVVVFLTLKDTQNATITEAATCNIVTNAGAALASVTLDATGEWVVLRAISATDWAIVASLATIA